METETKTKLNQPHINTLMAEINIVKIGNKQMTISVFNQLYAENCYDKNSNIIYPVWGKVKRDSEWVIFQKGNDLRKCLIPDVRTINSFEHDIWFNFKNGYSSSLDFDIKQDFFKDNATLYEYLQSPPPTIVDDKKFVRIIDTTKISLEEGEKKKFFHEAWQMAKGYGDGNFTSKQSTALLSLLSENSLSEIKENYRNNRSIKEGWNKMVSELNNSKQIFIAV